MQGSVAAGVKVARPDPGPGAGRDGRRVINRHGFAVTIRISGSGLSRPADCGGGQRFGSSLLTIRVDMD